MGLIEQERQGAILEFLRQEKKASVSFLSKKFHASEATIRRDLTKMEKQGHVLKTYGGAILSIATHLEFSYNERLLKYVEEKERIGLFASKLVNLGDSIFLDSGTTTLQISRNLKYLNDLTVITNALTNLQELGGCNGIIVYLLGGCYRPKSQDVVGPTLIDSMKQFAVDIAFLSVDGFHPTYGLSAADPGEAEVVRTAIKIARRSIVVADSSKGGIRSFSQICSVDEVDMIITDNGLDKDILEDLQQKDVQVELV